MVVLAWLGLAVQEPPNAEEWLDRWTRTVLEAESMVVRGRIRDALRPEDPGVEAELLYLAPDRLAVRVGGDRVLIARFSGGEMGLSLGGTRARRESSQAQVRDWLQTFIDLGWTGLAERGQMEFVGAHPAAAAIRRATAYGVVDIEGDQSRGPRAMLLDVEYDTPRFGGWLWALSSLFLDPDTGLPMRRVVTPMRPAGEQRVQEEYEIISTHMAISEDAFRIDPDEARPPAVPSHPWIGEVPTVALRSDGAPAAAVLEDWSRQTGWRLVGAEGLRNRPVSVSFEGEPALSALEAVCGQIGARYRVLAGGLFWDGAWTQDYRADVQILEEAADELPRAWAGPFVLRIERMEEISDSALADPGEGPTLYLSFHVEAQPGTWARRALVRLTDVRDENGAAWPPMELPEQAAARDPWAQELNPEFNPGELLDVGRGRAAVRLPPAAGATLSSIRGILEVHLPLYFGERSFTSSREAQVWEGEGVRIRLDPLFWETRVGRGVSVVLEFPGRDPPWHTHAEMRVQDAAGRDWEAGDFDRVREVGAIRTSGQFRSPFPLEGARAEEPIEVRIRYVAGVVRMEFPFEFRDVSLGIR